MKRALLFLLLLNGMCSKAQTYYSFPDSNAVWNFTANDLCVSSPNPQISVSFSVVMTTKDTAFNGVTYHQLRIPYYKWDDSPCSNPAAYNVFDGAIRQDKGLKKVFYVPRFSNSEQLLYDFNLKKGDTLKGYLTIQSLKPDIVQSVDSVLVGGVYHKRWNINEKEYAISIIEGVGSSKGFATPTRNGALHPPSVSLNCFKQNNLTLYPTTTSTCESILTSIAEDEKNKNVIVFPNPSNGSFTLQCSSLIKEIYITDLSGKLILKQQLNNLPEYKLDGVKNGVYILTLIDKNSQVIRKKMTSFD